MKAVWNYYDCWIDQQSIWKQYCISMIRFKRKLASVANLNFLTYFDRYFNGFHKSIILWYGRLDYVNQFWYVNHLQVFTPIACLFLITHQTLHSALWAYTRPPKILAESFLGGSPNWKSYHSKSSINPGSWI